jgi:putative two-component system response regulator
MAWLRNESRANRDHTDPALPRTLVMRDDRKAVVLRLVRVLEAHDPSTAGHCKRVAHYAAALGRNLGLPADDVRMLRQGGHLHDIGKIALDVSILRKPGRLSASEFAAMQRHTVIGDELCARLRIPARVRDIICQHHERLDGSGYPHGVRGDDISLLAQIVGIADVFDALTTERPYRPAMDLTHACIELRHEGALGWRDPCLVEAFVKWVGSATDTRMLLL